MGGCANPALRVTTALQGVAATPSHGLGRPAQPPGGLLAPRGAHFHCTGGRAAGGGAARGAGGGQWRSRLARPLQCCTSKSYPCPDWCRWAISLGDHLTLAMSSDSDRCGSLRDDDGDEDESMPKRSRSKQKNQGRAGERDGRPRRTSSRRTVVSKGEEKRGRKPKKMELALHYVAR